MFNFLTDDPPRHRVDIVAQNVASEAVCLDQWCSTAHERIGYTDAGKVVCLEEAIFDRPRTELCQEKSSKQCTWSPSEPLMDGNNGPIILLDLLLPQCLSS